MIGKNRLNRLKRLDTHYHPLRLVCYRFEDTSWFFSIAKWGDRFWRGDHFQPFIDEWQMVVIKLFQGKQYSWGLRNLILFLYLYGFL
ncbi:hypothetical protein SAMN04487969_102391 [Paenibacillus algorifonticola]|uniref:Uncharacterized protein n=1 Tax=Paenibacillus algorifonticola TaxID=684063 RepID=A0A1I2AB56_9BACL|nr:hypothetical protein SAMN04487969_102391 [Paenibacillus algorifonticola]